MRFMQLRHWLAKMIAEDGCCQSEAVSYLWADPDQEDVLDYFATYFNLDTIRLGDVQAAADELRQQTQAAIASDFPEEIQVWRCGDLVGDVTSVTTDKNVAVRGCASGYYGNVGATVGAYTVKRSDVLASIEHLWPAGDFVEGELLVRPNALRPMKESLLREYIRGLLAEAVLADVPDLDLPERPDTDPRRRSFDYSRKEHTPYRRAIKKAWNKYADRSYWQDPNEILVVHWLGKWSEKDSLHDYFAFDKIDKMIWEKALKAGVVSDEPQVDDSDDPSPYDEPSADWLSFYDDKDFYDSVVKQVGGFSSVKIPGINVPSRDELSCVGYPQPVDANELPRRPHFTFKKYRVTFASAEDAGTERLSRASPADKKRHAGSGLPKRPATNIELEKLPLDKGGVDVKSVVGEIVIDNWIIDTFYGYKSDRAFAERLGIKFVSLK